MTSGMYDKIPNSIRKSIDSMISRGYNGDVILTVILAAHCPSKDAVPHIINYIRNGGTQ
jgi:hypothetical protein